ncbi:MAG TPA: hypothetical protein VEP73_10405, partial [Actinomycetota bacterium]|nr:hypothetical protein [Actinomycetota bacterium]
MRSAQRMPGPASTARLGSNGDQSGPPAPGPAPRRRRGRVRRIAGLAAAGWVLLFAGILIGTQVKGDGAATPARSERSAVDGARCAQAIARANESLAMAVRVERSLADRTRLRQLETGGELTPARARELDSVAAQRGAMASSRF